MRGGWAVSWAASLSRCPTPASPSPSGTPPALLGVGVAYLVVIALRPAFLARVGFLAPLFEAGIPGHAKMLFARMPHLAILIAGHYTSFWFFDVHIPVGTALTLIPIVLVAITLPITPQGFGTRDMLARSSSSRSPSVRPSRSDSAGLQLQR